MDMSKHKSFQKGFVVFIADKDAHKIFKDIIDKKFGCIENGENNRNHKEINF